MESRIIWILLVLHGLVSLVWALVGIVWPERVVWFGGVALVPTHVATGLLIGTVRVRKARAFFLWAVSVADALGLVPIALYTANLIAARVSPDGPASPLVRQLAHTLWTSEMGLAITALVLVLLTALVHIVTIVTCLVSSKCAHCCDGVDYDTSPAVAAADTNGESDKQAVQEGVIAFGDFLVTVRRRR